LKRFVDAAHRVGLAVLLDVVYNHLGPEGNYFEAYGPYFTDRYRTPWGAALNFDGPDSDPVRRFFLENALVWQSEYHLDGLRLDAVHAIRDFSAVPFLEELGEATRCQAARLGRPFHLIAESDLNMARHTLPQALGGYGLDAQWSDDFHHALHVILTGERLGYYADYDGLRAFGRVWREGYAYTGQYSRYRRRRHGSSPRLNPVKQFVVCAQNHDQVGNRMLGDRLSARLSFDQRRCAAAAVLLCPMIPLLFMGEEYGETAPFQYFVSHGDPALVEAVRQGRREEFEAFAWKGEVPDPQDEATFERCKLNRGLLRQPAHVGLRDFHRECLRLRREIPALARVEKETQEVGVWELESVLVARCWTVDSEAILLLHFGATVRDFRLPAPEGQWRLALDSSAARWGGVGSERLEAWATDGGIGLTLDPWSALVLERVGGRCE
jgi:maltooligosyltrehalose trehalohydrolase